MKYLALAAALALAGCNMTSPCEDAKEQMEEDLRNGEPLPGLEVVYVLDVAEGTMTKCYRIQYTGETYCLVRD